MYYKYPRTLHLPWSEGLSPDDIRAVDCSHFVGKEVVVTEKVDGECTTMYCDHIHARSIDSKHHPSRTWVKTLHGSIKHEIPEGFRVCGENVYARHSIEYDNLPSYFLVFGIYSPNNTCLSWDDTKEFASLLGLQTGGADHIIAHAAAGHIPHGCITKSFTETIDEVNEWSNKFYALAQGKIGYVPGDLYHLWHGDIKDRQYLKRIKEFTDASKTITMRDENGLHINQPVIQPPAPPMHPVRKHGKEPVKVTPRYSNAYMRRYYRQRETTQIHYDGFHDYIDDNFYRDMGYTIFQYVESYTPPVWMNQSYMEFIPEFDGTPPNDLIQDMPPLPVPAGVEPVDAPSVSQEVPSLPQAIEANNWDVVPSEEKTYKPAEVPSLPQANDVSNNWDTQPSDAGDSTPSEVPSLSSDVNDWDANFS